MEGSFLSRISSDASANFLLQLADIVHEHGICLKAVAHRGQFRISFCRAGFSVILRYSVSRERHSKQFFPLKNSRIFYFILVIMQLQVPVALLRSRTRSSCWFRPAHGYCCKDKSLFALGEKDRGTLSPVGPRCRKKRMHTVNMRIRFL